MAFLSLHSAALWALPGFVLSFHELLIEGDKTHESLNLKSGFN